MSDEQYRRGEHEASGATDAPPGSETDQGGADYGGDDGALEHEGAEPNAADDTRSTPEAGTRAES